MCRADEESTSDNMQRDAPTAPGGTTSEATEDSSTILIDVPLTDSNKPLQPTETVSSTNKPSDDDETSSPPPSRCRAFRTKLVAFYWEHEFLILVVAAILLAKAYPPLGAVYLQPDITASWIAIVFIFLMAGLSLKTSEFSNAFKQVSFNLYVQIFNFGLASAFAYGVSRLLVLGNIVSQDLADGMTIAASVPMTINMVQVMTKAADGDEAAAIFNSAFGNLVGVFLSPALILGYLGVTGNVDVVDVFYKLAARVLLPVIVGQILQYTSKWVVNFVAKYKGYFRQAQQYALVYIVYTVFCKTFDGDQVSDIGSIFIMIAFLFIILVVLMLLAWYSLRFFFRDQPRLRAMGLYGCTHKTVAMGLPLISAIYEDNPSVGLYTLPLLIWHSMQLLLGSLLAPTIAAYVSRELKRLEGTNNDDDDEGMAPSSPDSINERQQSAAEEGRVTAISSEVIMKGSMMAAEPDEIDASDRQ